MNNPKQTAAELIKHMLVLTNPSGEYVDEEYQSHCYESARQAAIGFCGMQQNKTEFLADVIKEIRSFDFAKPNEYVRL